MPDNVIKTDIQDYWRRSYVGDKEIPSSNVEWDVDKSNTFTDGKYIPLNVDVGSVVDIDNPGSDSSWNSLVLDVVPCDSITINVRGGVSPRAYGFIDKDNKLISTCGESALVNSSIKVPVGSKKCVINNYKPSVENPSVVINRNSSRLYAGDKEVDIMYAGDNVAYAKHKDNLLSSTIQMIQTGTVSSNLNNGSFKFTRNSSYSDSYIIYKITEAISAGENCSFSFDVTDFVTTRENGYWWFGIKGPSKSGLRDLAKIDHVGHYCISGPMQNSYTVNDSFGLDDSNINMNNDDYFIIKNIKLERNIVDTEYSLAPSVTDNRVKIGKHWYNTCTIGSQEWLSENLNEDLKDVVVKDVDWMAQRRLGGYFTINGADIGQVANVTEVARNDLSRISFNLSAGESVTARIENRSVGTLFVVDKATSVLVYKKDGSFQRMTYTAESDCIVYANFNESQIDDTTILLQSTHTSEGTWEGYYNNDASYGVKGYGKLYTWDCICSANETPSATMAKLLKDGWRVPTKADFDTLLATSGVTRNKLCEKWTWGGTYVGTNELGFSAMSCGYKIDPNGAFMAIDTRCILHSSTLNPSDDRQSYDLSIRETTIPLQDVSYKGLCRSIRLVRDVPVTLSAPPTTGSAYVASVDGNVGWVSE